MRTVEENIRAILADAQSIFGTFPEAKVVMAGGAVRDMFLGRIPHDYDVFVLNSRYISTADRLVDPLIQAYDRALTVANPPIMIYRDDQEEAQTRVQ